MDNLHLIMGLFIMCLFTFIPFGPVVVDMMVEMTYPISESISFVLPITAGRLVHVFFHKKLNIGFNSYGLYVSFACFDFGNFSVKFEENLSFFLFLTKLFLYSIKEPFRFLHFSALEGLDYYTSFI